LSDKNIFKYLEWLLFSANCYISPHTWLCFCDLLIFYKVQATNVAKK
jgi:hypothetical protein